MIHAMVIYLTGLFERIEKKTNFQLYNHSLGMERRMIFPSSDIYSVSSNIPILLLLQLCCIWSLVRLAHVACSQCLDCGDLMIAPFSVIRLQDEHNRFTGPSCFLEVHKADSYPMNTFTHGCLKM